MTTTVTINAHCSDTNEVSVEISDAGEMVEKFTLQDGETKSPVVYDDRVIVVREIEKAD